MMRIEFRRLVAGMAGGLAGSLALQVFRLGWDTLTQRRPKYGIFGLDEEADTNSIQHLWQLANGHPASDAECQRWAVVFHYVYGAAAGVAYAGLAERLPIVRSGQGSVFGSALWLVGDEIPIAALGYSDPRHKSLVSHAAALGVHLLFGMVVEGFYRRR